MARWNLGGLSVAITRYHKPSWRTNDRLKQVAWLEVPVYRSEASEVIGEIDVNNDIAIVTLFLKLELC